MDETPNDRDATGARHDWNPDEALASLASEREVFQSDETEVQAATRIFKEGLVPAVAAICHISVYSPNERLRLDASKYVVERNLGRLSEVTPDAGGADPLLQLLGDAVSEMAIAPSGSPVTPLSETGSADA